MKNAALILSAVVSLVFAVVMPAQQPPEKSDGHLGTWQLVSTKYDDTKDFQDYPKERRRLRMLTATHFTWVDYDTTTGKTASSAGGHYTLKNGVYTETIEFFGEGMQTYFGKKQVF